MAAVASWLENSFAERSLMDNVPTICPGGNKYSLCAGYISMSIDNRQTEVLLLKHFALCPSAVPQMLCWASLCTRECVKQQKVATTAKGPELTANKKGLRRLGLFSPSSTIWKGFRKMRDQTLLRGAQREDIEKFSPVRVLKH